MTGSLKVGIVGYPLTHTVSPIFQQVAFDHYRINAQYKVWQFPPEKFSREIRALLDDGVLGFNVTIPYKQAIIPMLDSVAPSAEIIGAVNTVVNDHGKFIGYNTDANGFLVALQEQGFFAPEGRTALILGAGGSARAVCYTLVKERISTLVVANRTLERASTLLREFDLTRVDARAVEIREDALDQIYSSGFVPDLVVNCTSIGMLSGDSAGLSPLHQRFIPHESLVYDLVYNPPETPLLLNARSVGASVLGGLHMLVHQGAQAFELWTHEIAPVDRMLEAARCALK